MGFAWRKSLREALRQLADLELQQKLWTSDGSNGADFSSFAEAVEQLFTDTGLSYLLEKDKAKLGKEAESLLGSLKIALGKVDVSHGPLRTIDDPNMAEVRNLAKRLLEMIPDS
jgi:hypothetical protein